MTTRALKTINIKGSLDNYILSMSPEKLNSKYGEYLRELMEKKLEDPDFEVPALKLQAWSKTNRRARFIEGRRKASMYLPAHLKATIDRT